MGITLGCDGTLFCPNDPVTRGQMAAYLHRASRVHELPSFSRTTLDSAGDVGLPSSITIGADGRGLISYYDGTNGDLKVARCVDLACTAATLTTLDNGGNGDVGKDSSITIGADGLGLISYLDVTNADLKVAHCGNTACTAATLVTLDSAGAVGGSTSITIGADGRGLISYYDGTNGDLKVAHCNDTACGAAAVATIDTTGDVGSYTSITIGADGLGLISYYDGTNGDLKRPIAATRPAARRRSPRWIAQETSAHSPRSRSVWMASASSAISIRRTPTSRWPTAVMPPAARRL